MAQLEQAHSREAPPDNRAEIRKAFGKLISEHRASLHEEDRKAILKTVEGDFDMTKARTLLETLPQNLEAAKKKHEELGKAYQDPEIGSILKKRFGSPEQMTFEKKDAAANAYKRARTVDKQMKEWELAGLIAPANRKFKLEYFLGLDQGEQERIQNSLAGTLDIEGRKKTLERFLRLPENIRKPRFVEFRSLSEEQRKAMVQNLEKEIAEKKEQYIAAYREKMRGMMDPDAHGLSLFSTKTGSGSSSDLYMKWFASLPVSGEKSMETYLQNSDLDDRERIPVRDAMAKKLLGISDPALREKIQREFNEADLSKRREILAGPFSVQQQQKKNAEKGENSESSPRAQNWLTRTLENLHLLPKSRKTKEVLQTRGILGHITEERRRAELRWNKKTREGLEEAAENSGGELAEKVAARRAFRLRRKDLRYHEDERQALMRKIKPDIGREDHVGELAIEADLRDESDHELTTEIFQHTEMKKLDEEVAQNFEEEITAKAKSEGMVLDQERLHEGLQKQDLGRIAKEQIRREV